MAQLAWVEDDGTLIETESANYDYVIEKRKVGAELRRYQFDSEHLLSVIPCTSVEAAQRTAQDMENLIPKQKARLEFGAKRPNVDFSEPGKPSVLPQSAFYQDDPINDTFVPPWQEGR